jgi:hypothetical protein
LGIAAGVVAVLTVVAVAIVTYAPDDATGYGPELEERFVGWCRRAGGEADGATDADSCRCAYGALAAVVPFERFREVDERLRDGDDLPAELRPVVAGCIGDDAALGLD